MRNEAQQLVVGMVALLLCLSTAIGQNNIAEEEKNMAYLGVAAVPIDEAMTKQLGLSEGVGLVVTFLDQNGPSAEILEPHDVIYKLNDQVLVSPRQLAVTVRMLEPDDIVKLQIIREGKRLEIETELGETDYRPLVGSSSQPYLGRRSLMPMRVTADDRPNWQMRHGSETVSLEELQGTISGVIEGVMGELRQPGSGVDEKGLAVLLENLRAFEGGGKGGTLVTGAAPGEAKVVTTPGKNVQMSTSVLMNGRQAFSSIDDDGVMTLTIGGDGKKSFTAKDKAGKVLFSGPIDSEEDQESVPAHLIERLDELKKRLPKEDENKEKPVAFVSGATDPVL